MQTFHLDKASHLGPPLWDTPSITLHLNFDSGEDYPKFAASKDNTLIYICNKSAINITI